MSVPEIWYKAYAFDDGKYQNMTYHGKDARSLNIVNSEHTTVHESKRWVIKRLKSSCFGACKSKSEAVELLKNGLLTKWLKDPNCNPSKVLDIITDMQRYLDNVEDNLNSADDSGDSL